MKIPKLRFKEFSGEWEEKILEQLCDDFIVPMRDKPKDLTGIIPWCRIEDFKGKYLSTSKSNQGVSKETVEEMNLKIFPIDTLLVSCSANLGKCAIVKKELITNQTFIGLIPNKDTITIEYFYYLMTLQEKKLNLISTGTTISYLSKDEFKNYKVLLSLNLQEQEKIADFLSSVDKKISITEEKLNLFKEYKKGVMQKIFTQKLRFKDSNGNNYPDWEEKRLGDIANFLDEKRKPLKEKDRELKQGVYPYYGSSGIIDYIDSYLFDKELILLSEDGANIVTRNSRICFLAKGKYWVNNHAHVIEGRKEINQIFLCEYLENLDYKKLNTGTAQPKLNQEVCKNILINLPTLEEQEKIGDFLSSIDNKIENLSNKLENLKDFKKGLLQKMFI